MGGYGAEHLATSIRESSLNTAVEIYGTHADPYVLSCSTATQNFLTPWSKNEIEYVEKLCQIISSNDIDLLIPKSDKEVAVVSKFRGKFPCKLYIPDKNEFDLGQDKLSFYQILEEYAVSAAKTVQVKTVDGVSDLFSCLPQADKYWLRIKTAGEAGAYGATWVNNPDQAIRWITLWDELNNVPPSEFVLSEYLPGRLFEVLLLFYKGEFKIAKVYENLAYYSSTGIRDVGSTPSLAKSVNDGSSNAAIKESIRAVRALSHKAGSASHGIYHLSVKQNLNGDPCITECNVGRFPSTCGFLNKLGNYNTGEWFVKLAFDLEESSPKEVFDCDDSETYLIRSMDKPMALKSVDQIKFK